MRNFDQLTEDYSRHRVPDSITVSGLKITVVLVGAMITLPVFLVGAQLASALGLKQAIVAFFIAGIALSVIAGATGVLAARTRLTTWVIIRYSFGHTGARIVSAFIGITVLGWYGATVDMFARAVEVIVRDMGGEPLSHRFYLVMASGLMIAVAIFGFKGLDRLSKLAVPIMVCLLGWLVYVAATSFGLNVDHEAKMGLTEGISAGIGGFIVATTMFPDVCRYARSPTDAVQAASFSFGLGVPVVLLLAAIPVVATAEADFLKVILIVGLGVPGLTLLLLATWTTNAYNLYSASLVFATIAETVAKWKLVIVVGFAGTLIAMLPILDNFLYFLKFLAFMIPPVAGVYLADYFWLHKQRYTDETLQRAGRYNPVAFLAWILGSFAGYLSEIKTIVLTTVPAVDAIVIGFSIYVFLSYILVKWSKRGTCSAT